MSKLKRDLDVSPWETNHQDNILQVEIENQPKINKQQSLQPTIIPSPIILNQIGSKAKLQRQTIFQTRRESLSQKKRKKSFDIATPKLQSTFKTHHNITLQEKLIQQKLLPHPQHKKYGIVLRPIAKNDIIINIPKEQLPLHRITIGRPIRHLSKNIKETGLLQKQNMNDFRQQIKELDLKYHMRKYSVDSLPKNGKKDQVQMKNFHQFQDKIVKKCTLKNINIYQQDQDTLSKEIKKIETSKKIKFDDKRHILDRILTKFQ